MLLTGSDKKTENAESIFKQLLDEILKRRLQPEDKYEVAAILESMGWNDDRATHVFGSDDIFSLASDLWDATQRKVTFVPFETVKKKSLLFIFLQAMRNFLRGLIFALPMAISVMSMLVLRFSLWSYEELTLELATSIAIGTILSFLTVGGFTQSIARRGFFYIMQDYYNMARKITFYFIKLGYVMCIVIAAVILLFNVIFEMFPFRMVIVIVLYYLLLTAIWLSVTVMYILRKEYAFTGLLIAGIVLVFILFKVFEMDIIVSQIISLAAVSIAGLILVIYYFISAEKRSEKGIAPKLPRMSITLYSVMPYFIYGFFYFLFIYIDRIIAWSTNDTGYMPYLIWFRGPYELGLDLALLTLMIPMGLIEVIVGNLMEQLETSQKFCSIDDIFTLAPKYIKYYFKRLVTVVASSVVCAVGIYFAALWVDKNAHQVLKADFSYGSTTWTVFILALAGYALLTAALMNSIILFSVSQPELVNQSIFPAIIANVVVGFLLSRWFRYEFAIFGLLAGTLVFLVLSTKNVLRALKNLDYYLYATS